MDSDRAKISEFLKRAADARSSAEKCTDATLRRHFLQIAAQWEDLAEKLRDLPPDPFDRT